MAETRRPPDDLPQPKHKHPAKYEADLNPDHLGGQNIGIPSADLDPPSIIANDCKDAVNILHDFNMDELKELRVLQYGARLKQGAVYVDLNDPERRELTIEGEQIAERDQLLVPKAETPYQLWNRLRRVEH
jgi:hypothetical protein